MAHILIVDACKPSLVMSSEVFKDKIPGSTVAIAGTGKEALDYLKDETPDMCVVDFDLPDADGASLIVLMRRIYEGPILLTAYPDAVVEEAISDLLFHRSDASIIIPKPVRFDALAERIELFLVNGHRVERRFESSLETLLTGKAEGRGKRAPKVSGKILDISIGGAKVKLDSKMKMKKSQDFTISLALPAPGRKTKTVAAKKKSAQKKATKKKTATKTQEAKFKATVAWVRNNEVGLSFGKLTDVQRKGLERFLRGEISP